MWTVCKEEIIPAHAMKVHKGSGGIAPLTLNLGSRWRCIYVYLCMRLDETKYKESGK
jgi:hypothetical protein